MCITPRVVKTFGDLYASNGPLSRDDRAMLFTSMVVQPESLMLKVSFAPFELFSFTRHVQIAFIQ
jgi:hypothetical protein